MEKVLFLLFYFDMMWLCVCECVHHIVSFKLRLIIIIWNFGVNILVKIMKKGKHQDIKKWLKQKRLLIVPNFCKLQKKHFRPQKYK